MRVIKRFEVIHCFLNTHQIIKDKRGSKSNINLSAGRRPKTPCKKLWKTVN